VDPIPGLSRVLRTSAAETGRPGPSTYQQVTEQLGAAICGGVLAPGTVLTIEDLEAATGASRSIVRESTRVLVSMGLLRARQRVGFQVRDEDDWNYFDPQIIRWRLLSQGHDDLVRSLVEIRIAIEPEAARLAAERGRPDVVGRLMVCAGQLWVTGTHGDQTEFVEHDTEFHRLILRASGNPLFARLSDVVQEALRERALQSLVHEPVNDRDVQLHIDLAHHVQRRESEDAWRVAREIVVRNRPVPASPHH